MGSALGLENFKYDASNVAGFHKNIGSTPGQDLLINGSPISDPANGRTILDGIVDGFFTTDVAGSGKVYRQFPTVPVSEYFMWTFQDAGLAATVIGFRGSDFVGGFPASPFMSHDDVNPPKPKIVMTANRQSFGSALIANIGRLPFIGEKFVWGYSYDKLGTGIVDHVLVSDQGVSITGGGALSDAANKDWSVGFNITKTTFLQCDVNQLGIANNLSLSVSELLADANTLLFPVDDAEGRRGNRRTGTRA